MHILGESLLNDGSAIVFFTIFSLKFMSELNLGDETLGQDVNWVEGFALFFRMSLGGAAIGIAFSIGLIVLLFCLNRHLNPEEVVQVSATIATAYLCFYTAKVICRTSGVIAIRESITTNTSSCLDALIQNQSI
mmetsp:Transcript_30319/g.46428  ORF Transcript_30319/g.46428 Transcript_30319/m.46428 type:complete len:134 (+) Transcript_30319:646-1047(+)